MADLLQRVDFLLLIFGISVMTGVAWAVIDSTNVLFDLHLTQRVSRADPWVTTFRDNAARKEPYFVRVITKDAGIYDGSPLHYSESGSDRTLVLDLAQREILAAARGVQNRDLAAIRCAPVGVDVDGKVIIPGKEIVAVEFRPKIHRKQGCAYECNIPPGSKVCR